MDATARAGSLTRLWGVSWAQTWLRRMSRERDESGAAGVWVRIGNNACEGCFLGLQRHTTF